MAMKDRQSRFGVMVHPDHNRNGWVERSFAQAAKDRSLGAWVKALVWPR